MEICVQPLRKPTTKISNFGGNRELFFIRRTASDGSGTQNPGFGFWKCRGKMGLRHFEQGFSLIFAVFDDFSKVELSEGGKNLSRNEEKASSTCLKLFFRLIPGTRKPDFQYPI